MATNCEWKLHHQQTTDCGWKWEETVVRRCKCSKLRWEIATNCKWWKLQQTTKREAVTNFFHNVFFKNVSFQNVFFQNVFFLNVFCSRELQRTAVESYNTLQPGSTVGIWCELRNEFATNWGWKLQQTSNGSCNNLRTAVGSFYENLRLEVAINCGWKLQQSYKLWMELATKH